jgi:c-di-GMP-related signal transduction protein
MEVFVARQPIMNRNNQVFAYELLYRTNEKNFFDQSVTSNVATSLLLMNSYYTFGIETLVGESRAFINFDKHLINAEIPMLLNKEKIVVELLEDIIPDRDFMRQIRKLKENGYTIALDDYVIGYPYQELIDLSDIIKVDFFGNTKEQLLEIAQTMRYTNKILLAEKVETQEIFEWAKSVGYDLFQGYYFAKPSMVKGKGVNDSSYQYVRILEELNKDEPDYKNISSIIETDVSLTYKLLKLVNSHFTSTRKITSIQHGLSILGIESFRKWVSLAMVQNLSTNKPQELVKISMTRAKFLELIGLNSKLKKHSNEMMLVGILSVLDAMLEKPMSQIVSELPISENIKKALILETGDYTQAYRTVLEFEQGHFEQVKGCLENLGVRCEQIPNFYYEAIGWAEELFASMVEK